MSVVDEILQIYSRRGDEAYVGEPISVSEHAAQAAYFAREEGAPPSLILAALLHDIGHLLRAVPEIFGDGGPTGATRNSVAVGSARGSGPPSPIRFACTSRRNGIYARPSRRTALS